MSRLPHSIGAFTAAALLLGACAGTTPKPEKPVATETPRGEPYVDYVPESEAWRDQQPEPGEPPEIVTPRFTSARLDNGLTVIASERHELPLVAINVALRAGSAVEPPGQGGLADLAYEMLLEGAGELDAIALADAFADLGGQAYVSTGPDGTTLGVRVLSRNLDQALALLADVIQRPRLEAEAFERKKSEHLANLARMLGNPQYLAQEAVTAQVFGEDHPYGHLSSGTPQSVSSLSLKDVRDFLSRHAGPEGAAVVLAGDVTLDQARALAEKHFGSWRLQVQPTEAPPEPPVEPRQRVVMVPKPGMNQTILAVGRPGVAAGHPDEWALRIASTVYGGFFASRLNMNLREDKGYTYGAFSQLDTRRGVGPIYAFTSVRGDVTGPALREVMAELEGLSERPITEQEMEAAREGIMRSIPGWFETVEGLAGAAASLFQETQPLNRYDEMLEAYQNMDLARVRAAAEKYFTPQAMDIVLVGDPETIRTQIPELDLGELVERQPAGGAPTAAAGPGAAR